MIGLPKGTVKIVPYQPDWQVAFGREADALYRWLRYEFHMWGYDIRHVGSTALEGMPSKPIIDIMVGLPGRHQFECFDPENGREFTDRLAEYGYEYRPLSRTPERVFWAKGPRSSRTHHLSFTPLSSDFWREHLHFLAALRARPDLFAEYAQLKMDLAKQFANDRAGYAAVKASFFEKVREIRL